MNTHIKSYILLLSVIFFSCGKYKLEDPQLEVTADKTTIKAGDAVKFSFKGNPQILSFYSGDFLNDYSYESKSHELKNAYLSFSSTTAANGKQPNQLSVLVSSDFSGTYNITSIKAATWLDITSRFVLATNSTATASTEKDIMDVVVSGKPLYLAFRYTTKPQTLNGPPNDWAISAVLLNSKLDAGNVTVLDYSAGSNFAIFSFGNKQAGRSAISTTAITFKGNATAALNEEFTEDWGISRAMYISPNDLGTDKAIALKLFTEAKKESYTYTYTKAGVYMATFIGQTNNVYGNNKVVKQIEITVTN